jgi:glycosyltransferase involved in cell wall biosynthesis
VNGKAEERPLAQATGKGRILFVAKTNEFGGAERHLLELIRRLARWGIPLSILCLDSDFYSKYLKDLQVEVIIPPRALRSFQDWFRAFRQIRPDVVVLVRGVLWTFEWYIPVAAWLAGIRRRVSIAHLPPPTAPAQLEGWSVRSALSRFRRMRHCAPRRVSALFENSTICVSNAIRDSLMREYGFPAGSTITIHNGVSLSEFEQSKGRGRDLRARLRLKPDEFVLVCVARLSEQKQLDILLLAVARALRDGIACKCLIVGDGPLRKSLEEQSLALGLSDAVLFEGFQEDVRPYLQAGTAFVLTSRREGLPLSILEAMACGLPCIVTRVGGNCEVVTHGVDGLVVSPGAIDEIASAIVQLATHRHRCEEMSRMARSKVQRDFNLDDRMAQIEKVLLN